MPGCVCFERRFNAWKAGVSGTEKRVKSSIAGTSVFTVLGCIYRLKKMEWACVQSWGVGKHLLGKKLGISVKRPHLVAMWEPAVVPSELSHSSTFC